MNEGNGPAEYGDPDLERIEINALLQALYDWCGYDYRGYAYPSIQRRIRHRVHAERLSTISGLQEKVLHDPACLKRLIADFSINVTEMYRDPAFFLAFRERVVPLLRTYPVIRIWHAGCSTGEEVYSMAILLHEEGLYDQAIIYATDINTDVLQTAKQRSFPMDQMRKHTQNYLKAGGRQSFSDYYYASGSHAVFHPWLARNIVFARHNLVTDGSFNVFNVILCRNVLIYFNRTLQDQVHELFYDSLCPFGVLGLGDKETIGFTPRKLDYEPISSEYRIYRKRN